MHLPDDVPIRSQIGCWALVILNGLTAVSAAVLLIYSVTNTLGYAGLIDHAAQLTLLGISAVSGLLAIAAWRKIRRGGPSS